MTIRIQATGDFSDPIRQLVELGRQAGMTDDQIRESMQSAGISADKVTDAFERLGREIDETGRDGARDLERVEDSLQDVQRQAKRTEDAVDDIGDGGKASFGKVREGAQEVQQELGQNMGQAFSSFRGDLEDVGQIGQDTLGGLAATVASMGPLGLAAGAGLGAAAAGVGVIVATWQKVTEATDEAKDAAYNYAFGVVDAGEIVAQAEAIKSFTGDLDNMKKAQDIVAVSGVELETVVKALATGEGLPALSKAFEDGANNTTVAIGRLAELDGVLRGTAEGLELGAAGAKLNSQILYDLAVQSGKATGEVDDLGRAVYELPGGKQVVVDAATQQAHENLDDIENRQVPEKTVPVRVVVDDSAWRNYKPAVKTAQVSVSGNPVFLQGGRWLE